MDSSSSSSSYRLMWLLSLVVFQALAFQFQISMCSACSEQERTALLQIKASMSEYSTRPYHTFPESWDSGSSDCCGWDGVECDITTGKVIKLLLSAVSDGWHLNASVFLPFEDLAHLDLSANFIRRWVPNNGVERLSALSKLQVLILDHNRFNNTILPSLGQLTSLRTLSLSDNRFEGSFELFGGFERLSALSKLQVLILDRNYFNNTILPSLGQLTSLRTLSLSGVLSEWPLNASLFLPFEDLTHLDLSSNYLSSWVPNQGLERLSALSKLQVLILDDNGFNDTILPSLGQLSSLRTLSLYHNMLEGSFELLGGLGPLHALDKLEVLDLSWNNLNNSILPSLGLHSTLKALSLYGNEFTGSIDVSELSFMSDIEELDLSGNDITDFKGLESLGKLKVLTLGGNRLNGSRTILQSAGAFQSSNGSSIYSNLLELDLSGNHLEGMIPSWFGNFTSLRVLDLSHNQFEGNLALSPVAHLNTLECLSISDNILEIPLSLTPFFNHSKLKVLIADNNRLLNDKVESHLPSFITTKFQLRALSFNHCWSNNPITGLPNFFHHQTDLRLIDLSHINLALPFPSWLVVNNSLLEECNMRNNSLTGSFLFPSHRLFPQMTALDLSDNGLEGQALETIGRVFPRLQILIMSENLFGGHVPTSIGKLKYLKAVDLSNNYLSGEIPTIDCPSLRLLILSHNRLSGKLSPSLYNLTSLEYLYLDDNHFVGEILDISPHFSLTDLDLSNNNISGKLPRWIGNMTVLHQIALASNHLEGSIPVEYCNLGASFEFLDLSDNDLSGSIPSCFNPPDIKHVHLNGNKLSGPMTHAFCNSSSLVTLDLIDNNLAGSIPSWIGKLYSLSVLLLKLNNFDGVIPLQLCDLKSLSILDLSQNSLSGRLPLCLTNMPLEVGDKSFKPRYYVFAVDGSPVLYDPYSQRLRTSYHYDYPYVRLDSITANQQVEFSTKFGSYSYKGGVLDLMSGIDLSCNNLTGEIPAGIGNLSNIHALNLSHNHLTGPIPTSFSNLAAIESLDLSYNNLNGRIPPQLVELVSLGSFSVAHNNLSGPLPDWKAQFGTFDEKSYEGNPLLCGPPLVNSCSTKTGTGPGNSQAPEKEVKDDEMIGFYASCVASYVTVLITIAAVLLINPRWRCAWLYYVEVWMTSSYYFVMDAVCSVINRRRVV